MCNPSIIILDEPFSGLDPVNAQILKDIIRECIKQDKLLIFSSHQMNYIEEFCENIALINKGEIVLQGNLKEIKGEYGMNTTQGDGSLVLLQMAAREKNEIAGAIVFGNSCLA